MTAASRTAFGLAVLAVILAGCKPLPSAAGATPAPATAADSAGGITIAPEDTGAHYRREDWLTWAPAGGGCDAREAALKAQGSNVKTGPGCKILTGVWISSYDGLRITNPAALDLDHAVPLAEVQRSGARNWTPAQRKTYANDQAVLVAVTAKTNRSKGDQDPAKWLPPLDHCRYVQRWQEIKTRYHLTEDQAEASAIAGVLAHCPK